MSILRFTQPIRRHGILLTLVLGVLFLVWITLTGLTAFSDSAPLPKNLRQESVDEDGYAAVLDAQNARINGATRSIGNPFSPKHPEESY